MTSPSSSAYLSLFPSWKSLEEIALALPNFCCAALLVAAAAAEGAAVDAAAGARDEGKALPPSEEVRLCRPTGDAALPKKSLLMLPLAARVRWPSLPRAAGGGGGGSGCDGQTYRRWGRAVVSDAGHYQIRAANPERQKSAPLYHCQRSPVSSRLLARRIRTTLCTRMLCDPPHSAWHS